MERGKVALARDIQAGMYMGTVRSTMYRIVLSVLESVNTVQYGTNQEATTQRVALGARSYGIPIIEFHYLLTTKDTSTNLLTTKDTTPDLALSANERP
jgi:hypothetical protein